MSTPAVRTDRPPQHPADHQRSAALRHPRDHQFTHPDPRPRPTLPRRDPLRPGILSQPRVHPLAGEHNHRPLPLGARRLDHRGEAPRGCSHRGGQLSEAGYQTALVGKAHFQPLASRPDSESLESQPTLRDLDFWREFRGPWYGFDSIELARNHTDESHSGQHYAIWLEEQGLTDWRDYFLAPRDPGRRRHRWELPEGFHYSKWTADKTIEFSDRNAAGGGEPFLVWASFQDPHPVYLVPEPWASMYDPAEMVPAG